MSTCNQSEQYEQHLWSRKFKFQNREMPRSRGVHYRSESCSRVSAGRSCYGTFVCPAGCFEAVSADAQRRNVRRCGIWHDVGVIVVLLLQALGIPNLTQSAQAEIHGPRNWVNKLCLVKACKDHCWQIWTPALKIKIFRNPRSELGSWRWVKNSIASRYLVQCRSYKDHWAPRFVRVLHRIMVEICWDVTKLKIIARFQFSCMQMHQSTTYLGICGVILVRRTRADLLFFLRLLYTGQAADETLFCVLPFRQWDMRIMNDDIDFNICNPVLFWQSTYCKQNG